MNAFINCCNAFLPDSTDRQNPPTESNFTSHWQILPDWHFEQQTQKAGYNSYTCRRTILLGCSIREMNMYRSLLYLLQLVFKLKGRSPPKLEIIGMCFDPTEGNLDALFHDISQLASDLYLPFGVRVGNWLYHQQLATHRGPGHAVHHANAIPSLRLVPSAQKLLYLLHGDPFLHVWFVLPGHLTTYLRYLSLQRPDSHLIAVLYNLFQSLVLKLYLFWYAILFYLKRK